MTFEIYFIIRSGFKGNWTHLAQKNSQPGSKIIKTYKLSYHKNILKTPGLLWESKYYREKVFLINYLIILLIKMTLVIFLAFTQYGLACKYGIVSLISIYNWMQNCISNIWGNNY